VTEFGMSELMGPRTYGEREEMIFLGREIHEQRDYGEATATQIDREVTKIIKKSYQVAKDIITKMRPKMDELADRLMTKETIEQKEFEELFKTKSTQAPSAA
jgi:cell division protease FtsH